MTTRLGDTHMLLGIQAVLVSVVASIYLLFGGGAAVRSALYGGLCALLNAWLLGRRWRRAAHAARVSPGTEVSIIYVGALQRFAVLLGLFVVGMGWLKLEPVPLLVAFAAAQSAFLMTKGWRHQRAAG